MSQDSCSVNVWYGTNTGFFVKQLIHFAAIHLVAMLCNPTHSNYIVNLQNPGKQEMLDRPCTRPVHLC